MSRLTDQQRAILAFARNHGGMITITQAEEVLRNRHFYRHRKNISDTMGRMTKNNLLTRVDRGRYMVPGFISCDFCGQAAMKEKTHCEKCAVLRVI